MTDTALKRDNHSQAVLNTDISSLNKYRAERQHYRTVESLKSEVKSIQATLNIVCDRLDKLENK